MFEINEFNRITLTIGDTATFTCSIEDLDGDKVIPDSSNSLTLYIDDLEFSKPAVIDNGNYVFIIAGTDTSSFDPGVYMYRVVYESKGSQYTIMQDVFIDLLGDKTV